MWMVRAGEYSCFIDDFRKKSCIAVDWDKLGDISQLKTKEEVKELVEKKYDYSKKSQLNISAAQIGKFLLDFKKGDYVISYDSSNRVYLVGEIQSILRNV